MSIETIKCPQCGENASIDTDREFGFCSYCGFKIEVSKPAPVSSDIPTADSLLARAQLFIEENDFAKAEEYFNKVLDINPYTSSAYIGLLTIKLNAVDFDKLSKKPQTIEEMSEFKNAIRFAENEETKQRYTALAQKKQAEFDARWDEREKAIQKKAEVKQKEHDARYTESLRSSIKSLNAIITVVDIVKAIHAFCAAIGLIASAFLGLALLGDFELIFILIPVVFLTAFTAGGTIGLDKLSDGLTRMLLARENTLESML